MTLPTRVPMDQTTKPARTHAAALAVVLIALFCTPGLAAAIGCGDLATSFGPFDYRTTPPDRKLLVEGAHFTPKVESLTAGKSSTIAGDIDYTLRVFPNHPRALLAMSRIGLRLHTDIPIGARFTGECYFERAIRFTPDDPMPHLIHAIHLKDRGHKTEALAELDAAAKLKPEMTGYEFPYNMALEYTDLGVYDKALEYAQLAYQFGAPFPGVRKKLEAAGKWREPEQVAGQAPETDGSQKPAP